MQTAKRYLVIAASFTICMATFAAFTPRIAHAVVAALVQVTNTTSNPVPTQDVDNGPRHAIQLWLGGGTGITIPAGSTFECGNLQGTNGADFVVPPGKRLVVDSVSSAGNVPVGQRLYFYSLGTDVSAGGSGFVQFLPPLVYTATVNGFDQYQASANFSTSSDSTGNPIEVCAARNDISGVGTYRLTVNGRLVDCNGDCSVNP